MKVDFFFNCFQITRQL